MNITKRKFKAAFNLCTQLSEQGFTIVKLTLDGKSSETELIARGSAITWCAKEFVEDPENLKLFKAIEKNIRQLGTKHALKDKDTKAVLYEKNAAGSIIGYQNTGEDKDKYEDALEAFLDETIDFSAINVFICPHDDLVKPVPHELNGLNGLILNHAFWSKPKTTPTTATQELSEN